jgi:hypothetical protein
VRYDLDDEPFHFDLYRKRGQSSTPDWNEINQKQKNERLVPANISGQIP